MWSEYLVAPRAKHIMIFAVCLRGGGSAHKAHSWPLKIRITQRCCALGPLCGGGARPNCTCEHVCDSIWRSDDLE